MGVPPLFLYPGCRSMQRTLRGWMQAVFAAHGAGEIKKLVGLLQRVFFSAPNASIFELFSS